MNEEELLAQLYDLTLVGNAPAVLELTNVGLEMGLSPEALLFNALIPSLEEVGARFERGDFFVPEMLIAGRAMAGAMDRLRPLLIETGVESIGTFVMGTVKGDVHDIGKNLCNIMLEGAGFQVIDLGVQVAPEKFVAAVQEHQPDIVGFSAFLTTTMPMFKANINALREGGPQGQGDGHGRRCSRHPGVRRRSRRGRLRGRRFYCGQPCEGAREEAPPRRPGLSSRVRRYLPRSTRKTGSSCTPFSARPPKRS